MSDQAICDVDGRDHQFQSGAGMFVRDDVGPLKRVMVHSPTDDEYAVDRASAGLLPQVHRDRNSWVRQHAEFVRLLGAAGAEIVQLANVLAEAVEESRRRGTWEAWLSVAHPKLSGNPSSVTAQTLLGRDPSRQYQRREDGSYRNLVNNTTSTTWARDAGFMTPKGMVICNARSQRRLRENLLLRFVVMHAPSMARYPVLFDAVAEGVIIEGGDAQVIDENTLLLGVGQATDPRAAQVLAQRLGMDVLAVRVHKADFVSRDQSPGEGAMKDLRVMFLHLDTFFTQVDRGHVLGVPWFLEMAHLGEDPLSRYIRGARAELSLKPEDAEKGLAFLKELGTVSMYEAGTGTKLEMEEMKLLDFAQRQGWRVTYTGGQRPEDSDAAFAQFMRETLGEQRRQASNVVATGPRAVISYAGSPRTEEALRRDGVTVSTFGGRELWLEHGGPHCLTMPLERA